MTKKRIEGRIVAEELHRIWKDFQDKGNPVDEETLTILFKMRRGNIYFNDKLNLAIGFCPAPQNLLIYFFEIRPNKKLKYIDFRGVNINESTEIDLKKAIEFCKILKYDEDKEDFDNLYQ